MKFKVSLDSFNISARLLDNTSAESPSIAPIIISHESKDLSSPAQSKVLLFGNANRDAAEHGRYSDDMSALLDLYINADGKSDRDINRFPLLCKLIPVRIVLGDPDVNGADIILWYYPTDEFLKALPAKLGDKIRTERENLARVESKHEGDTTHSLLEKRFSGDYQYSEVTRGRQGSVEILSVGPNPAHDHATLRFKLYDERSVSIVIYDMSGQMLKVLSTLNNQPGGENDVPLDLHQLSSGAYLLTLISDKGEQAIQRFIIQN
jgi:hypothetical protein